jgi:hypothetical protein
MKKVMMLCLVIGIVGLQIFQSWADTLPQGLDYMNVQQRNVESGITYNRLYFSMYDQNQTPPGDVLASATLYDPNGVVVNIPFPTYAPVNLLMGHYDVTNGQWNFSSGFDYFDNGYTASFDGNLIPGDYRLQVTTINGSTDELTFKVSTPVECPIISSSSFHVWIDQSDNLIWEWALPSIDPGLNTSISAYMQADGDNENFFLISVPTHVNRLTIPKTTFDLLTARGDNIKMGLNLRVNDEFGNNFQRNISNPYFLSLESVKTTTVLTATDPDYTVTAGSQKTVYGTSTSNKITIERGAKAELINFSGQNVIEIEANSIGFTVSRSGSIVLFKGSDGTLLKIPATQTAQIIDFAERPSLILIIHNGQVMLDDRVINTTPVPVSSQGINTPQAYYSFDNYQSNNTSVLDHSGNENDLEIYGLPESAEGIIGSSIRFIGDGSYLADWQNGHKYDEFTISFWYKHASRIFENDGENGELLFHASGGYVSKIYNDNEMFVLKPLETTGFWTTQVFHQDILNIWTHITITYKDGFFKVFNNGEDPIQHEHADGHLVKESADYFMIGSYGNNHNSFDGFIDEFRIYNFVLSDNEIKELFEKY